MNTSVQLNLRKILRLSVLTLVAAGPAGCASASNPPEAGDPSALVPSVSNEDSSHGWGTAVQNTSY